MDKEKLEDVKTKLNEIADILYKGDVIEGLANMNCVISDIAAIASDMPDEETRQKLIDNALTPLLEAMEQEDGTLMADLISYELLPLLN